MQQPHPFAKFVAILARGKTKTRPLTLEEAEESMGKAETIEAAQTMADSIWAARDKDNIIRPA